MSYYKFEVILNYPRLEAKPRINKETGETENSLSFSAQALIGSDAAPTVKSMLKYAKATYPNANQPFNDIKEGERDILGEGYKKRFTMKGWGDYINCFNLYKEKIDVNSLRSGDRVLLQVKIIQVNSPVQPGVKYIRFCPHIITVIQKEAYTLFDAEASLEDRNEDYFKELQKYQQDESLSDEAPQALEAPDISDASDSSDASDEEW